LNLKACAFLLLAVCALTAYPAEARACECVSHSVSEAKRRSRAVFVGTVIEASENNVARFAVEKLWKGENVAEFVVYSQHGMCSSGFVPGSNYLVYARWDEEKLRLDTDMCSRTRLLDDTEDVPKLGRPKVTRTAAAKKDE
jgi:hypothetical protein